MNEKSIFVLFANCIPVNGIKRSCIYDLQRQDFYYIPNGLFEILTVHKEKSINEIKSNYDPDLADTIDTFFQFLLDHELGFFTSEPENFPTIDLTWEAPELITNCILEYGTWTNQYLVNVCKELEELRCKFIEYRFYKPVSYDKLREHLGIFRNTFIRNINLLICYHSNILRWDLKSLLINNQRIGSIVFHSCPSDSIEFGEIPKGVVHCTQEKINSNVHCGQVSLQYMSVNIPMYTESLSFNSCLNRKISVDDNGNIKNCPSMSKVYGNVETNSLIQVSQNEEFKKIWHVTKDNISVCNSCEYRYACLDCRAFIENPLDSYSKPLKCGYNPVTGIWEDKKKSATFNNTTW